MTDRRRNLAVVLLVLVAFAAALLVIIPGSPLSQATKLGLDLEGGVELVYEGRPTPKVPEVTPEAIDDAIQTIRKRTDSLGVSEPEIQRAGADQISVGLPNVDNAERAIEQVGTTAQLQFYDWEANIVNEDSEVVGEDPIIAADPQAIQATNVPIAGSTALYEAAQRAADAEPVADETDIPPGGVDEGRLREAGVDPGDRQAVLEFYDRFNDTGTERYYLFGPNRQPIFGTEQSTPLEARQRQYVPGPSCEELLTDFLEAAPAEGQRGEPREYAEGTECAAELEALGSAGPPPGSTVVRVPQGIVIVEAEQGTGAPASAPRSYFVIEDDSALDGSDIENPEQNSDPQTNLPVVTMEFTDEGRAAFAAVTQRLAERGSQILVPPGSDREQAFQRFAITLDNRIVSLATINFVSDPEGIDGRTGAQITNIGSLQETQDLAEQLRIGSLPIELRLISQTQVSATLGQQALDEGLVAAAAGFVLVLLFLLTFYRVLGVVASFTLVIYGAFLFALVKLIPITLTLPGIAGMVLTLGVAADANIVIFERIKEEARTGRSIPASIATGYRKALATIIDANVVTIGVAFILFMLATAGVKGFAFTLGVGVIVSLLTAVVATSAILGLLSRSRVLGSRFALGAGERHRRWRFDFYGTSKWFFSGSGLILVAGALAIAGLGINFGIDFESGTRIKTPLEQPASVDEVRDALPAALQDAKIQAIEGEEVQDGIQIATETLTPEEVTEVREALDAEFGVDRAEYSTEVIGPTFGEQIARTAVVAIIASLILISIYIGLRFEFKFAVPVLIAIAHDILITAGVYAIADRELTTSTVAAFLTILGYSLYDTIIVFDRIRENVPRMPRATFSQIVNRSMSEVLTRSLATSFSTLMPVAALMFFGGETLQDFAFALLVGTASGAYSSIFIAAPVLTHWKEREPLWRRRRQIVKEDHGGVVPAFPETALGDGDEERAGRQRQPAGAQRARRTTRAERSAGAGAPAATAEEAPPAEAESEPEPQPEPEPRAPAERGDGDGDGDGAGDGAGRPSAVTSTSGGSKQKRARNQRRRKHGRR
ncbi:MAG: protein translocase subunit SecD [Thermoleophilaceae bacterium]